MLSQAMIEKQNMEFANKQRGVVLFIALIVLVAMTLAGIALVRSVDTTNVIAGNLAFQQAATNSGDIGAENAIAWLETENVTRANLYNNNLANGYAAFADDSNGFSWDALTVTAAHPIQPRTLAVDGAGNTVLYIVQRLCAQPGDPYDTNPASNPRCVIPPVVASNNRGDSKTSGTVQLQNNNQQYFRITARVEGPRNTLSFTQVIVAM